MCVCIYVSQLRVHLWASVTALFFIFERLQVVSTLTHTNPNPCARVCTCIHLSVSVYLFPCVGACLCVCDSGLGRVSIAGGLWLLRSDYIGATGGVSRLVVLSVFSVADWTDTQRREMAQPETLGLQPRDLTGIQPHNVFTRENAPNSYLICEFHVCHWI